VIESTKDKSVVVVARFDTGRHRSSPLGAKYGFEVENRTAQASPTVTGEWRGSVDRDSTVLLKNKNHVVRCANVSSIGLKRSAA